MNKTRRRKQRSRRWTLRRNLEWLKRDMQAALERTIRNGWKAYPIIGFNPITMDVGDVMVTYDADRQIFLYDPLK